MIQIRLENDKYFNWDIENEKNIFIKGGTGSGKSVVLSQLQNFLNDHGCNTIFIGREEEIKTIVNLLRLYPSRLFVIIDELCNFERTDNSYNAVELVEELQKNPNLHLIVATQNTRLSFLQKIEGKFEINISSIKENRENPSWLITRDKHLWLLKRNETEEVIKFINTSIRY